MSESDLLYGPKNERATPPEDRNWATTKTEIPAPAFLFSIILGRFGEFERCHVPFFLRDHERERNGGVFIYLFYAPRSSRDAPGGGGVALSSSDLVLLI